MPRLFLRMACGGYSISPICSAQNGQALRLPSFSTLNINNTATAQGPPTKFCVGERKLRHALT